MHWHLPNAPVITHNVSLCESRADTQQTQQAKANRYQHLVQGAIESVIWNVSCVQ